MMDKLAVACPRGDPKSMAAAAVGSEAAEKKKRSDGQQELFCTWKGPLDALSDHLSKECGFQLIQCPYSGCGSEFKRHELQQHDQTCPYAPVGCLNCSAIVERREEKIHLAKCPGRPFKCDACGIWHGIFKHFQSHTEECPKMLVTCGVCEAKLFRDAMDTHLQQNFPSHFATLIQNMHRVKELSDANVALRQNVAELQNTCDSLTTATFSPLPPTQDGWRTFIFRVPDGDRSHYSSFTNVSKVRCVECGETMCQIGFNIERVRPQDSHDGKLGRWIGFQLREGHKPATHKGRLQAKFEIFRSADPSLPVTIAHNYNTVDISNGDPIVYEAGKGLCIKGKFAFTWGRCVLLSDNLYAASVGSMGALYVKYHIKYEDDVAP